MKSSSRNFIVEYKGARRAQKEQRSSIWGDTDFKALVREAGTKAPHLFNTEEPNVPLPGARNPPSVELAAKPSEVAAPTASATVAQFDAKEVLLQEPTRVEIAEAVDSSTFDPPTVAPRSVSRDERAARSGKTPISHKTRQFADDQRSSGPEIPETYSLQELDALDVENKRLKTLLVQRSRAENAKLKEMIRRFNLA